MRALVPLLLLLLTTLDAAGAVTAGPELPLAPPAFGEAYGHQQPRSLATDGTDFLMLWTDETHARQGLYAAAIDEHGVSRPTPPRRLVSGSGAQSAYAVWTGSEYLVVWTGQELPIQAARVSRDAQLLSPYVAVHQEPSGLWGLAWNGQHALAVLVNATSAYGLLVDASGTVVRRVTLPARERPTPYARVVAVGSDFVALWTEVEYVTDRHGNTTAKTSLHASRVSGEGEAGARVDVFAVDEHLGVDAASDGTHVGIVANEFPRGRLQRFTLDPATMSVTTHEPVEFPSGDLGRAIVTPDGFASSHLRYSTPGGMRLVTVPFASTTERVVSLDRPYGYSLLLAASDRVVMAVWSDPGVFGVALDPSLTERRRDVTPATLSVIAQDAPVVAPANDVALVTWMDTGDTDGRIVGVRVNRAGHVLDAQPIVMGTKPRHQLGRAAVYTGKVWLVAWEEYLDNDVHVVMRRVARDGTLLDAAPVDLGAGTQPALASNGDVTVLAAHFFDSGLSLLRYSPEGTSLDAAARPLNAREANAPVLTSNGREFLLAWEDGWPTWPYHTPNLRGIYGVRLDAGGSPIDAAPIVIADTKLDESAPQLASDGTDFLVLYAHDWRNLQTKRVLRNGALADSVADQQGMPVGEGFDGRLGAVGREYYVTFIECCGIPATSLRGVTLDARGAPAEAPRSLLARPRYHAIGGAWLAYSRLIGEGIFDNVPRVFVRVLAEGTGRRRSARN